PAHWRTMSIDAGPGSIRTKFTLNGYRTFARYPAAHSRLRAAFRITRAAGGSPCFTEPISEAETSGVRRPADPLESSIMARRRHNTQTWRDRRRLVEDFERRIQYDLELGDLRHWL